MNTAPAAAAAIAATVGLLISGSAGAAAAEIQGASEVGIAHGTVVRDDLPRAASERSIREAVERGAWTRDALREFHASLPTQSAGRVEWSAEVLRELKGGAPAAAGATFTADAMRELKGSAPRPAERQLTADELRELKGSTPGTGGGR